MIDIGTLEHNALKEWNINSYLNLSQAKVGLINKVIIIETKNGKFVLKKHTDSKLSDIKFTQQVVNFAIMHGIPTPPPIPTRTGECFLELDNSLYTLYNHIGGAHLEKSKMSNKNISTLGQLLSEVHSTLFLFPKEQTQLAKTIQSLELTTDSILRFYDLIMKKNNIDIYDKYALAHLESQKKWLDDHRILVAPPVEENITQMVHGDFQNTNILFDNRGKVTGILDWDLCHFCPKELDILRSLHYLFDFSPYPSYTFLKAYQQYNSLSFQYLESLSINYVLSEANNLWMFKAAYLKSNERVRRLFNRNGFNSSKDKLRKLFLYLSLK